MELQKVNKMKKLQKDFKTRNFLLVLHNTKTNVLYLLNEYPFNFFLFGVR